MYLSGYELIFLKVAAPKAWIRTNFISPKVLVDEMDF